MPRIVLCKTPSTNSEGSDIYADVFSAASYDVRYLSVLQEEFRLAELGDVLQGVGEKWEAVVMTSKRSAEAWIQAVHGLEKLPDKSIGSTGK